MRRRSVKLFRRVLIFPVLILAVSGCAGPEQTISKKNEEEFKHPSHIAPPEYKGNTMAAPSGPPPNAPKPGQ